MPTTGQGPCYVALLKQSLACGNVTIFSTKPELKKVMKGFFMFEIMLSLCLGQIIDVN